MYLLLPSHQKSLQVPIFLIFVILHLKIHIKFSCLCKVLKFCLHFFCLMSFSIIFVSIYLFLFELEFQQQVCDTVVPSLFLDSFQCYPAKLFLREVSIIFIPLFPLREIQPSPVSRHNTLPDLLHCSSPAYTNFCFIFRMQFHLVHFTSDCFFINLCVTSCSSKISFSPFTTEDLENTQVPFQV